MRRVIVRAGLLMLAFAFSVPTQAADVCTELKAQLANASTGAGSSANYRRYARAAEKQTQQINKVRSDLKQFGCASGSFLILGGRNAAACAKLSAAHTKMRANLAALERKRDSYAQRANKQAKRQIQAALKANDCDGKRAAIQAAALRGLEGSQRQDKSRSPGLVAILGDSGGKVSPRPLSGRIVVEPKSSRGGNYRTLCVRTCDGFFFPISSSAWSSDFARDERTCQMMCPGTQTELYFHSALGQESEDMVSARTREPYSALPNAFAYRGVNAPMSKACGCNMAAFYREMARREAILNGQTQEEAKATTWVRPFNRPDPGEDPETIMNSELPLSAEDIASVLAASSNERPLNSARSQVRVVGPTFLPDQSDRLDLKPGETRTIQ